MKNNIKFIYFDVGGVLIDDLKGKEKWDVILPPLGLDKEQIKKFLNIYEENKSNFCVGKEHIDLIFQNYSNENKIILPEDFSISQRLVELFIPNIQLHKIILELFSNFKVGLLTNMWTNTLDGIKRRGDLLPNIRFENTVDSSIVKMLKPNRDIYEYAQKLANVPSNEILFIDDREEDLIEPRRLGWETLLYDIYNTDNSNKRLLDFLSNNEK